MAGGKETPRQKMIGMMYLFLTAMLALNVSKDILNSFVLVNDSLTNTVENFNEKNRSIYDEFEKQASMNEAKVGKWNDLAKEVRAKADEISKIIDDLKVEVVKNSRWGRS
jgi:gliding motility-associated protein GldM